MDSFKDLDLSPTLMRSIEELGYEKPSPIQAEALPVLLGEPTDFIGLAATGTGKTAAFGIPLLERIDVSKRTIQAIVLCPTRELALQVSGQINLLGKHKGVRSLPIYGGSGYREQIDGLKSGVPIVVGTPGRVIDHLEKGTLKLDNLQTVILDEADEMISMGFKDELDRILSATPRESANIWLFSATMSPEVRRVADTYLTTPKQVQINRTEMLSATVEQSYYFSRESNKPEILCKIIDMAEDFYGIIFCQTKALVMDLTQLLSNQGYKVDCLHGDKDQRARERTMQLFRDRTVNVLVCTDVAARGLDVKDITHVINYSLPRELDSYVHRIGRTARSGKAGFAISLVTPSHKGLLTRIERLTKSRIVEGEIPTRKDVGVKKVKQMFEKFMSQKFHERATSVLPEEWVEALENMPADEIAGRFIAMTMPDVFEDRGQSEMVRLPGPPARDDRESRGRSGGSSGSSQRRAFSAPRPSSFRREPREAPLDPSLEADRAPSSETRQYRGTRKTATSKSGTEFKGNFPKREKPKKKYGAKKRK
jgi:ATP-dependent RNA helicase DeaD